VPSGADGIETPGPGVATAAKGSIPTESGHPRHGSLKQHLARHRRCSCNADRAMSESARDEPLDPRSFARVEALAKLPHRELHAGRHLVDTRHKCRFRSRNPSQINSEGVRDDNQDGFGSRLRGPPSDCDERVPLLLRFEAGPRDRCSSVADDSLYRRAPIRLESLEQPEICLDVVTRFGQRGESGVSPDELAAELNRLSGFFFDYLAIIGTREPPVRHVDEEVRGMARDDEGHSYTFNPRRSTAPCREDKPTT